MGHSADILHPGIGDASLIEIKGAKIGQRLEQGQPGVGDFCSGEIEVLETGQTAKDREIGVIERRIMQIDLAQLGQGRQRFQSAGGIAEPVQICEDDDFFQAIEINPNDAASFQDGLDRKILARSADCFGSWTSAPGQRTTERTAAYASSLILSSGDIPGICTQGKRSSLPALYLPQRLIQYNADGVGEVQAADLAGGHGNVQSAVAVSCHD
jgi:hypothetical protein